MMSKTYYVKASNFYATYTAGTYVADSREEALRLAEEDFVKRAAAKRGEFRYWTTTREDFEES